MWRCAELPGPKRRTGTKAVKAAAKKTVAKKGARKRATE